MITHLKVAGFYTTEDTAKEMEQALGHIKGVDFVSFKREEERKIRAKVDELHPDVVVFEMNGHADEDLDDLEALLESHRDTLTVYVAYRQTDIETTRRLMHAGVRDMFPLPLKPQAVMQEFTHLISERRIKLAATRGGRGSITCFINAKGGSGGTTVALNTAQMLASHYKARVLFIDLDIQFGAAAILFDLKPHADVLEALLKPERIDAEFLNALVTPHDSGLHILASPADLSPLGGISADATNRLIGTASDAYDYVIVDVPRILTAWTLAAVRSCDPIFMVLQNTLSAMRDAKLLLDRLAHEGIDLEKVELINNRAMSSNASVDIAKLKDTLDKKYIHRVRNDFKAAREAQDRGCPVADVSTTSPLTKDLLRLAEYIVMLRGGEHRKKGFLERFFGLKKTG